MKNCLILILVILYSLNLHSEILFLNENPLTYQVDQPASVVSADYDNDGDYDLFVASMGDDFYSIFENDGFCNFRGIPINIGLDARDVEAGDLDNDGDIDFVGACWQNNTLVAFINNGNFKFTKIILNSSTNSVRVCKIFDLNKDGLLDIISGSGSNTTLDIYFNKGNLNFEIKNIYGNSDGFRYIDVGDADNDGDYDIVAATWFSNGISLYINNNYNFNETVLLTGNQAICAKFSDINKDGLLDIAYCFYSSKSVGWLKNQGSLKFQDNKIANGKGPYTVAPTDYDKDGDIDIFCTFYDGGEVVLYENDGKYNFKERLIQDKLVTCVDIISVDINKDGLMDAVSTTVGDNKVCLHLQNKDNTFLNRLVNNQMTSSIDVAVDDFDKDGDVDVIGASYYNDNIVFYECVYTKKYSPKELVKGLDGLRKICTGDFNNDGLFDIASVSWWDNKVAIHYNLGDMKFKSILLDTFSRVNEKLETKRRPCWCEPVDLNKDGKLDILVAYYGSDEVVWYKNTGSGFTSSVLSKSTDGIECVVTSDIDKDGDIDYATASWEDDKVSWFENVNGKFVEHIISKEVDLASAVNCNDINNDGFIDIVATSYNEDKLFVFENNGKQVFKNELVSNNVNGARNIDVGNLDNIGNKEIVCADWFGFDVKWFTKKGNNYTEALVKNNLACASAVKVVDMDKDGDLDVVTASTVNNKIAWYENKTVNIIKPGLQYPLDESKEILKNTELVWTEVPYATKYKLQISLNKDFSGKVDEVELEATQTKIFNKIYNNENKYFWRVKAFGVVDSSDWSEIYSFETTSKINNSTEEEYLTRIDLEVLPNILENNAVIKISSPGEESATLELIDISGRKIEVIYNGLLRIGENNIDFYRNNLNSGIYFLILKTETEEKSVKIIVK